MTSKKEQTKKHPIDLILDDFKDETNAAEALVKASEKFSEKYRGIDGDTALALQKVHAEASLRTRDSARDTLAAAVAKKLEGLFS